MPDQQTVAETTTQTSPGPRGKQRNIVSCNFRSAGRLSNENARSLTAIHETFARHLASTLDAYLGTGLDVKLRSLEQLAVKDHIAAIGPMSYIIPFSLQPIGTTMIVECDIDLVFPMIELLLGGRGGSPVNTARELSEIEEEIMHDLTALIARQAENAWRMENQSLTAGRRIKSSVLHQYCAANEKVTVVQFDIELGGTTGSFQLVFPTAFLNLLLQQIKLDEPQKAGSVRFFPRPGIRERMLDSDVAVAAELPGLRVPVRDLIALEPGSVLKLRAPVRSPGMLTAGGHPIFEATPVRNGLQKAAQLGRRATSGNWERGE
ncbi:MAG TPA: FliM/FliN family flagellar motor switch protein [Acidobacteriaceae bacterium]|jgi:flagellar motor switch protein FliM|nr:FliM/FliN family flagellar motor switch protein [Acidobacteriaceae bacterium]